MRKTGLICTGMLAMWAVGGMAAETPLFSPKITEVTVFKDGHALIMAKGKVKTEDGWCRAREVPVPVLGTFWTFTTEKDAVVDVVRCGMVDTKVERACMTFDEIMQVNTGKVVTLRETIKDNAAAVHTGKLLGILENESPVESIAVRTTQPTYDIYGRYISGEVVPETTVAKARTMAGFVMLETDKGVEMIKRENITGISIGDSKPSTSFPEKRSERELAMHVVSKGKPVTRECEVGMAYLQKGLRWIPEYRIQLLEDGKAKVTLQGTVINELADIQNVNLHLVVGVPSFIMKDTISPMALREAGLKLSSYFLPPSRSGGRGGSDYQYLSNALMSQSVMPAIRGGGAEGATGGPDIPEEGRQEDLFLYDKPGFSLKKGESAMVQLLEVVVPYEDIYTWEIPPVPPMELWRHYDQERQRQLVNSLAGAKAMHVIRLTNSGEVPWTTGPAVIFKGNAILAQQLVTYTSVKNKADVPITVATDVNTSKEESEIKREENVPMNGHNHTKFFMRGKLTVNNFKSRPVHVIVTRKAMGTATSAGEDGRIRTANSLEDSSFGGNDYPWFSWAWPWEYRGINSLSEITWDVTIPAGKARTFEYDWYYFVRR